ncbi:class IIb bacteriocin, lactobin A/cerein 7B family [Leuconostoc rapi]|nr:class IIb bacteriocin, lactobin A/cerein 7B family [Leuconostoc rapi]MBM7436404.1 lactobin A/cerein 7B family class IIb bacteriocin [Leuconostoc rapi]
MNNTGFKILNENELSRVNGGAWWIPPAALAVGVFQAGYNVGKDVANRKH